MNNDATRHRHSTQRPFTETSRDLSTAHPQARIGRIFGAAAVFEAFTWAGLLVGMFLEHVTHTTDLGVWLFGRLHGAAFMIYVVVTLVAWRKLRWPLWVTFVTLAASIPPLTTLVAEWWLTRTGRLAAAPAPEPVAAAG